MRKTAIILAGGAVLAILAQVAGPALASAMQAPGEATAAPSQGDLPGGFTLYPGATIFGNTTYRTDSAFNTIVNFESADAPTTITAFYRRQAEAAGFEIQLDSYDDGIAILVAEKSDRMIIGLSASPSPDSPGMSEAQLTIGQDGL
ncbi:hypothetical protein [Erythrobacter donghaensis]|uniref:hypothetical protein n=1 Tax=Erythrobacter donghaensis TaxID=267135 RepID=UPI000A391A12|nr:hypothetical protein [Erythrobacter donghaensis]